MRSLLCSCYSKLDDFFLRVSEDFRVIALGLPVPHYHGNPLDPPLRSRFQARDIHLLPFKVCRGNISGNTNNNDNNSDNNNNNNNNNNKQLNFIGNA